MKSSDSNEGGGNDIAITMTMILTTLIAILIGLINIQDKSNEPKNPSTYLPNPTIQPSKYAYEKFCILYSPIWMMVFTIIVAFQLYEDFTAMSYNVVCLGCALPFLLQPILVPSGFYGSPDVNRPLLERYATKANLWLAVYSFIGNYWYVLLCCTSLGCRVSIPSLYTISTITIYSLFVCYLLQVHTLFLLRLKSILLNAGKSSEQRPNSHVFRNTLLL